MKEGRLRWGETHALVAHGPELPDLIHLALNELLATEAGVDRHDENEVHLVEDVLDSLQGGARVKDDPGIAAEIPDLVHNAMEVDGGGLLGMDTDDVGTSLGKIGHALLGLHNHLWRRSICEALGCRQGG